MHVIRSWVVVFTLILPGITNCLCIQGEVPAGPVTPPDSIIGAIMDFLPGHMKANHIPGSALTLIYDHRIAWSGGFGYRNSITRKPVEEETVFEVASNSKLITACLALLLVEQGKLALDTPLNSYLTIPWLPDSAFRNLITLRHVLTHTSGLGHNNMSREVQFPPGTGYQYSNLGFTYLQHVMEQVSGQPLEALASGQVFDPAGMPNTSFINKKELRPRLANGHIPGKYLLVLWGSFFLVSLLLTAIPGLLIQRFTRKHWLPSKRALRRSGLLMVLLWLVITFVFFGMTGWNKYAWMTVFFGTVFLTLSLLLFLGGRAVFLGTAVLFRRRIKIPLLIWVLVSVSGLVFLTREIQNIPVPRWPAIRAMAPASLRTTAPDMANFVLQLSKAGNEGIPVYERMLEPQVRLHPEISWGLGAGIFHSSQGDALWQWGQNVDFQSLVIFWPEERFGLVVLTNSEWGQPDVAIEIAQRALGLNLESVIRASHLEFSGELSPDPTGKEH